MPRSPSKTPSKRRVAAYRQGHRGEALAALWLQMKFYRIRERRFKTPMGEIDLVAERGDTIVFVEVKQRARDADAALTYAAVNRSRIIRAAQLWLAGNPDAIGKDFRFDVIFLAPGRWPRHLINAFSAS
ncbi:YraN family protein [Devosia sp. CAU 1758]